jgi:hypothetical protein
LSAATKDPDFLVNLRVNAADAIERQRENERKASSEALQRVFAEVFELGKGMP